MTTVEALARAAHPGPCVAVTTAAALLAGAAGVPAGTVLLVVAAVLAGQLSVGWSNDLVDVARDRTVARPDKPLATGAVSVGTVRIACALAVIACVPLSFACGWLAGAVHLAGVTAAWLYNLALKSTIWSAAPYAVAFGLLPVFASVVRGSGGLPHWLPFVGALLGTGAHLVNVVPDLADDAATGISGLPHRLGETTSVVLATGLLLVASAIVIVVPGHLGAGDVAATVVVTALAGVALIGRGRARFRAAMALALVDVVLVALSL